MTPESRTTVEFTVPPVEEVSSELGRLRLRHGIDYERMDEAPETQRLPVVTNTLAATRRSESDRPYVAYDQIECAARRRDLLGPDYSTVLVITLNFAHINEEQGQRRERAAAAIPHVDMKKTGSENKTYKNLERRAYTALAALLVRAISTPCSTAHAEEDRLAKVEAQISVLNSEARLVRGTLDRIGAVFSGLRKARSELTLFDACHRLLQECPLARSFAENAWGLTDEIATIARLMKAITAIYYEDWISFAVFDKRFWFHPQGNPAFSKDHLNLYWQLWTQGDLPLERDVLEELLKSLDSEDESKSSHGYLRPWVAEFDSSPWASARSLDASYLVLERIWWTLEAANDWWSLEPGARAPLPVPPLVLV